MFKDVQGTGVARGQMTVADKSVRARLRVTRVLPFDRHGRARAHKHMHVFATTPMAEQLLKDRATTSTTVFASVLPQGSALARAVTAGRVWRRVYEIVKALAGFYGDPGLSWCILLLWQRTGGARGGYHLPS